VSAELFLQRFVLASVVMIDDRGGFIPAHVAFGKNSVPHFRVAAASSGTSVQSFVKQPNLFEDLPPERHVGTGSHLPGRYTPPSVTFEEGSIVQPWDVASVETPVLLKLHLRRCLQFSRQNQPGHCLNSGIGKASSKPPGPLRVDLHIVICECHDVTCRSIDTSIPSVIESGTRLEDIPHIWSRRGNPFCLVTLRGVVDDNNLMRLLDQ